MIRRYDGARGAQGALHSLIMSPLAGKSGVEAHIVWQEIFERRNAFPQEWKSMQRALVNSPPGGKGPCEHSRQGQG